MKFLCPSCKAKYRIGPEKLEGRRVAKIRCRKCGARIHIARKAGSEEFDITATPLTVSPGAANPKEKRSKDKRKNRGAGAVRGSDTSSGLSAKNSKVGKTTPKAPHPASPRPIGAVPGLPGVGGETVPKSTRSGISGAPEQKAGSVETSPTNGNLGVPPAASLGSQLGAARPSSVPPRRRALKFDGSPGAGSNVGKANEEATGVVPSPSSVHTGLSPTAEREQDDEAVDDWFVGVNGVPLGPIPIGDLGELAAAGHIDKKSLVWREGFSEWRPLGNFSHLVLLLQGGSVVPGAQAKNAPSSRPANLQMPSVITGKAGSAAPESAPSTGLASAGAKPVVPANRAEPQVAVIAKSVDPPNVPVKDPSPWEDEEDEDDDQPTQVRGRTSAPPRGAPVSASPLRIPPAAPVPSLGSFGGFGGGSEEVSSGAAGNLSRGSFAPGPQAAVGDSIPIPGSYHPGQIAPFTASLGGRLSSEPPGLRNAPSIATQNELDLLTGSGGRSLSGWSRAAVVIAAIVVAGGMYLLGAAQSTTPSSDGDKLGAASRGADALIGDNSLSANAPSPPPAGAAKAAELVTENLKKSDLRRNSTGSSSRTRPIGGGARTTKSVGKASAAAAAAGKKKSRLLGLGELQMAGPTARGGSGTKSSSSNGLDAGAIQRTVRRNTAAVNRGCWQRALSARGPGTPSSARVVVSIEVEPNGKVTSAKAAPPRGYVGLGQCIESRVARWRFPRASKPTSAQVPFMFVAQ